MKLAILGAGVAATAAARVWRARGHQVVLLDKGRGAGGRCATRRTEATAFDHGAQYFTARDPRFAEEVRQLARQGWVSNWECRSGVLGDGGFHDVRPAVARWVGTPGMSSLVKGLQEGLEVHFEQKVERLEYLDGGWNLHTAEQSWGPFEGVVLTAPAPQAAALLQPHSPALAQALEQVDYEPCLAALVELTAPSGLEFDAATVKDNGDGLGFVGRNSSKPRRTPRPECWILHSSVAWAQAHLEDPLHQAASQLWQAFCQRTGLKAPELGQLSAHRWRYARVSRPLGQPYLWDAGLKLGWAGDGAIGPRLECAYLSGRDLAEGVDLS